MSTSDFLKRFTIVYAVVMTVISFILWLINQHDAGSFNAPVLLISSFLCFYVYSNKNSRILEGREKWTLIFMAIAVDFVANILFGIMTMTGENGSAGLFNRELLITVPLSIALLIAVSFGVKKQLLNQRPELDKT